MGLFVGLTALELHRKSFDVKPSPCDEIINSTPI